jgi:hypothetical protein
LSLGDSDGDGGLQSVLGGVEPREISSAEVAAESMEIRVGVMLSRLLRHRHALERKIARLEAAKASLF